MSTNTSSESIGESSPRLSLGEASISEEDLSSDASNSQSSNDNEPRIKTDQLEGFLTGFDNVSLWDTELKRLQTNRKEGKNFYIHYCLRIVTNQKFLTLYIAFKKERKPSALSFLTKSRKSQEEPTYPASNNNNNNNNNNNGTRTLRTNTITTIERSPIIRSSSAIVIAKTEPVSPTLQQKKSSTAPWKNWSKDQIETYKNEQRIKYEIQTREENDRRINSNNSGNNNNNRRPSIVVESNISVIDIADQFKYFSPFPNSNNNNNKRRKNKHKRSYSSGHNAIPIATINEQQQRDFELQQEEEQQDKNNNKKEDDDYRNKNRVRRTFSYPIINKNNLEATLSRVKLNFSKKKMNNSFDHYLKEEKLIIKIFSYLKINELSVVPRVCVRWNNIVNTSSLWCDYCNYFMNNLSIKFNNDTNIWKDTLVPLPDLNEVTTNNKIAPSNSGNANMISPNNSGSSNGSLTGSFLDSVSVDIQNSDLTLNQLVARLTPYATVPNKSDLDAFLATYTTFTKPILLLLKLIQRYRVPSRNFTSQQENEDYELLVSKTIKLRVCNIVKCLLQERYKDFDKDGITLLKLFIKSLPKSELSRITLSNILAKKIRFSESRSQSLIGSSPLDANNNNINNNNNIFNNSNSSSPLWMSSTDPKLKLLSSSNNLLNSSNNNNLSHNITNAINNNYSKKEISIIKFKSKEIAEQLTLIEYEYFKAIKSQEFIDQVHTKAPKIGSKPTKEETTDTSTSATPTAPISAIKIMIDHFNDVSHWTEETVLKEEKCKNRAKIFEKFIRIAKELKELNNFETLVAIISALQSPALVRLAHTRAEVNPKELKVLEELQQFMKPENNYKDYRQALATLNPPCIVYLGVLIRDLIYLEDSGASELQRGHINFRKKINVWNILELIQRFQSKAYTNIAFIPPLYDKLSKLSKDYGDSTRGLQELYNISLEREPRGAKRADILQ